MNDPAAIKVTFRLDEDGDGEHFWWGHDCQGTRELWVDEKFDGVREKFARGDLYPSMFPIGPKGWQLVSKDPLTVRPSIACGRCPCHGYITNGVWVPV